MQNLKKILPKFILFLVVTIIVIVILLVNNDIAQIWETLKNVDIKWLLVALLFLLAYIVFNPLSLVILGKSKTEDSVKIRDSMMIGTVEYFFNGITPFSTGGQPFQIYSYKKIGVSYHRASGIILMNFVVSQLSIVIMCLLATIFYQQLTNGVVYLQVMIIIGLAINIFILALFITLGVSKHLRRWILRFISWIFNLKIFKGKLEKKVAAVETYADEAQKTFKLLFQRKVSFLFCVITKLLGLIFYYMLPFFILKSLGITVEASQIALITAMTTFSIAMTCYIPTPGSAGGIEFAFKSLFVTILPMISASTAVAGALLWRLITYYLLMLISFVVFIVFDILVAKRKKKEIAPDTQEIEQKV